MNLHAANFIQKYFKNAKSKKTRASISLILFTSLVMQPLLVFSNPQVVSYRSINNLLSIDSESTNTETAKTDTTKQLKLELPLLSDKEKQAIIFSLFAQQEGDVEESATLLASTKDLELFTGARIFDKINLTKTTMGRAELAGMLTCPISDTSILEKRQAFIQELVHNQQLFNEADALLQEIRQAENSFYSYWKEEDPTTKDFFANRLYFNKEFLKKQNTNSKALEALTRLGNAGTVWQSSQLLATLAIGKYVGGKIGAYTMKLAQDNGHALPIGAVTSYSLAQAITETAQNIKFYANPFNYPKSYETTYATMLLGGMSADTAKKAALAMTCLTAGFVLFQAGSWAWATKNAASDAKLTNNATNFLQTRLIDVATIVESCKQLATLTQKYPIAAEGLLLTNNIHALFALPESTPFGSLITMLQTNTFKGNASFFSHTGRVLAAHELMKCHKEAFAPACQALGELDACMSIAKLYKQSQQHDAAYVFATYQKESAPAVHITGFWHPALNPKTVITNDITLGVNAQSKHIILTGSNTGGKSTILKAMMLSALFAQTITIAPAHSCSLTPFKILGSYLRIVDDIASGNSLFQAEVLRAQNLIEQTQRLSAHDFGFLVIDELFTGTSAEKGSQAAYKVAESLATAPGIVMVVATHFPQLTELEKASHGAFKNYKVDVLKKEDGSIERPFKLEPGISSTSIANDILQQELSGIDFSTTKL